MIESMSEEGGTFDRNKECAGAKGIMIFGGNNNKNNNNNINNNSGIGEKPPKMEALVQAAMLDRAKMAMPERDDADVADEAIMWASRITRKRGESDCSLEGDHMVRHTGELRVQV